MLVLSAKRAAYIFELVEDLDRILTITANEEYLDLGFPCDTPQSSQESSCDEDEDDVVRYPHIC